MYLLIYRNVRCAEVWRIVCKFDDQYTDCDSVERGKFCLTHVRKHLRPITRSLLGFFFSAMVELFQRENIAKLQSLVHRQCASPMFKKFRKCSWFWSDG